MILKIVLDVILYCTKNNLALRGTDTEFKNLTVVCF